MSKEPPLIVSDHALLLEEIRQNLTANIGNKEAEQFIRAEIVYDKKSIKKQKKEDNSKNQELEKVIRDHLLSIGVPEEKIQIFFNVQRSVKTLKKITQILKVKVNGVEITRYQGLPTKEEYEEFCKLPKTFDSLNKIKHPLLYNWTQDELVEAMSNYIGENAKRYYSKRCDVDECKQNGAIGLMFAIKTDAGMAPFAKHGYSRIRTSTRRPSAQSGIVKTPEKRPSVTEVLQAITIYLTGKVKQHEMDRHAQTLKYESFEDVKSETKIQEIKDKVYEYLDEIIYWEENFLGPIGSRELDEIAKDQGFNSYLELSKSDKSYEIINGTDGLGIGTPPNWQYRLIQKLGQKNVYIWVVSGKFNLRNLDGDVLDYLVDYLNLKFNNTPGSRKVSLNASSSDRVQCVADLVQLFATNPDFHGNPVSLDGAEDPEEGGVLTGTVSYSQKADLLAKRTDGGFQTGIPFAQPDEIASQNEMVELVSRLTSQVVLSDKQRVVLEHIYGINGKEKLAGSEIANNFGKLTNDTNKNRTVSRQRIAQFQEAGDKKLQDLSFEELEEDPKFYPLVQTARKFAGLTLEENLVFAQAYGLDHQKIKEVEEIAHQYPLVFKSPIKEKDDTGTKEKTIPGVLTVAAARDVNLKHVRQVLHNAKMKILRAIRC